MAADNKAVSKKKYAYKNKSQIHFFLKSQWAVAEE